MAQPPKKYQPVVQTIHALQYDGTNKSDILAFGGENIVEDAEGALRIVESGVEIAITDWTIQDMLGEFSSMTNDTFLLFYRPGGA